MAEGLAESGAEILIVPNGSPFEHGKQDQRLQLAVARVTETGLPLVYVNQVGGQDELVFDGGSFALDAERRLVAHAPGFVEGVYNTRWRRDGERIVAVGRDESPRPCPSSRRSTGPWSWACATTSTRTAFPASCSACQAASIPRCRRRSPSMRLGAERVHAVMMPSRYTSRDSLDDAADCAAAAGHPAGRGPDRAGGRGVPPHAGAGVREPGARHHRGEHPVAHPRRHPDGDLQQAGRHGAHHRQQVRDVGRLRHALRRHVRRLFGAQGRLQDHRVRALPLAQRGGHRRPARARAARSFRPG